MIPPRTGLHDLDPGQLIAAVPALLGFAPTKSIVLITYTGRKPPSLHGVVRMDLPGPLDETDAAHQLSVVAGHHDATVAELLILGGAPSDPATLPHRGFVEEVTELASDRGVVIAHTVWAPRIERGVIWRCYEDPECTGQVADPAISPAAVAATVAGAVTYATRAELAAQLARDPAEVLAHRAELLAALPPVRPERDFPFVCDTVDTIGHSVGAQPCFDDDMIVRLAHAVSQSDVLEACLAFALTSRAEPAQRLWTILTRAAPAPAVTGPACLLAVSAYLRGDGTLARVALDVALTANPDHQFAQTLRGALGYGLTPDTFRLMLAETLVAGFADRFTPRDVSDTDHP